MIIYFHEKLRIEKLPIIEQLMSVDSKASLFLIAKVAVKRYSAETLARGFKYMAVGRIVKTEEYWNALDQF